jgi:hypothetical protein
MCLHPTYKSIDLWLRFQITNDTSQGRAIVMQFRFFHTSLTIRVIEEIKHAVKRLLGIVDNIWKRFSLHVVKKIVSWDPRLWHDWMGANAVAILGGANFAPPNIVLPANPSMQWGIPVIAEMTSMWVEFDELRSDRRSACALRDCLQGENLLPSWSRGKIGLGTLR